MTLKLVQLITVNMNNIMLDKISLDNQILEKAKRLKYFRDLSKEHNALGSSTLYESYKKLCEYFKSYKDAGLENYDFSYGDGDQEIRFIFSSDQFKIRSGNTIILFEYEPLQEKDYLSRETKIQKTLTIVIRWESFKKEFESALLASLDSKLQQFKC